MTDTNMVPCRWCGQAHGAQCPSVKAIEYHPDGSVRRVEFKTAADYPPMTYAAPMPIPTTPLPPGNPGWMPSYVAPYAWPNVCAGQVNPTGGLWWHGNGTIPLGGQNYTIAAGSTESH